MPAAGTAGCRSRGGHDPDASLWSGRLASGPPATRQGAAARSPGVPGPRTLDCAPLSGTVVSRSWLRWPSNRGSPAAHWHRTEARACSSGLRPARRLRFLEPAAGPRGPRRLCGSLVPVRATRPACGGRRRQRAQAPTRTPPSSRASVVDSGGPGWPPVKAQASPSSRPGEASRPARRWTAPPAGGAGCRFAPERASRRLGLPVPRSLASRLANETAVLGGPDGVPTHSRAGKASL